MITTEYVIAIASDHAGFEMKQKVEEYLKKRGYRFVDFGAHSLESSDYPDFVHPLAHAIGRNDYQYGIILCGSGNGVNITANKHPHIRSALSWIPEIASLARMHNNANVLALPARYISEELAIKIVDAFLETPFEGGRHQNRVNKISCNINDC